MAKSQQLTVARKPFEGFRLPTSSILLNPIDHAPLKDKKASTKGIISGWLFNEAAYDLVFDLKRAVTTRWRYRTDSRLFSMTFMKSNEGRDVDIRYPVPVG